MKKWFLMILMVFFSVSAFADNEEYIETQFQKRQNVKKTMASVEGRCGLDPSIPFVVGSYATNPPFSWVDVRKTEGRELGYTLKGYNIDLITKMAKDLRIKVVPKAYKTDREAFRALQTGQLSAFVGMYYDPKFRKAGYTYVHPAYFQNIIGTVVLKSRNLDLKTMDDLKNLKGVVRSDERFYNYVRLMIPDNLNIQQVPDSRTAFLKLLKGEADYILTSPYTAEAEARRYKMNKDIKMQSLPIPGQEFFIVFSPVSPCRALNKMISQYLTRKNSDKDARVQGLIDYIDAWGQRFRNDKGLAQKLKEGEEEAKEDQPLELTEITEKSGTVEAPVSAPTLNDSEISEDPTEKAADKTTHPDEKTQGSSS